MVSRVFLFSLDGGAVKGAWSVRGEDGDDSHRTGLDDDSKVCSQQAP